MKKRIGWKVLAIIVFVVASILLYLGYQILHRETILEYLLGIAIFIMSTFFLILSMGCGIFYYLTNLPTNNAVMLE